MRSTIFGLSLLILTSCTVYSSVGRKDFESKSPDYIKTQSFLGCEPIQTQETKSEFYESFADRSIFGNDDYWVAEDATNLRFIQVLDHKNDQVCSYEFSSLEEWEENKAYFLEHLP